MPGNNAVGENNSEENNTNIVSDDKNFIRENKGAVSAELTPDWVLHEIAEAKKEVLSDAKKEINTQVQMDKASLITVFGIFASVISFLTIEFQFLKTLCSVGKITGFSLLLFSLMLGFNLSLDYLVKSRTEKTAPKPNALFTFFVFITFCMGIIFTFIGNEEKCRDNQVYLKYSDEYNKRLTDTDGKITNLENQLREIKK